MPCLPVGGARREGEMSILIRFVGALGVLLMRVSLHRERPDRSIVNTEIGAS
jgi:hypothetical protein